MLVSYPIVCNIALKLLIPFPSTYLSETAFSSMLVIETKARNKARKSLKQIYAAAYQQLSPELKCSSIRNNVVKLLFSGSGSRRFRIL